ncbi:hypothetical protein RQP46_002960 [Phenoliferia psychrophenolica]
MFENMDGGGDGTGRIPDDVLAVAHDHYFGSDKRFPDRRDALMRQFAARYGTKAKSSHDLRHVLQWWAREAIPAVELAKIRVPTLLVEGSEDVLTSGPEAVPEWLYSLTSSRVEVARIEGAPRALLYTDPEKVECAAFHTAASGQTIKLTQYHPCSPILLEFFLRNKP